VWIPDTRMDHDRDNLCNPSDLTDAERLVTRTVAGAAFRDEPLPQVSDERDDERDLLCARGGHPWHMLPEHFPSYQTGYR
jgi:hypothetical protein